MNFHFLNYHLRVTNLRDLINWTSGNFNVKYYTVPTKTLTLFYFIILCVT